MDETRIEPVLERAPTLAPADPRDGAAAPGAWRFWRSWSIACADAAADQYARAEQQSNAAWRRNLKLAGDALHDLSEEYMALANQLRMKDLTHA